MDNTVDKPFPRPDMLMIWSWLEEVVKSVVGLSWLIGLRKRKRKGLYMGRRWDNRESRRFRRYITRQTRRLPRDASWRGTQSRKLTPSKGARK